MTRRLPPTDAVIIGLGWTGSILAHELTGAGLNVVAIERGPWRDTATDFPTTYAQDELRYHVRHDLFLRPAQGSQRREARNLRARARSVRLWRWRIVRRRS
jgi:gluconate 2-dehydrogenase alpha chain